MHLTRKQLESKAWTHTHRDQRGKWDDGTKNVTHYVPGKGTCNVAVSSLTEAELLARLPRAMREAHLAAAGLAVKP